MRGKNQNQEKWQEHEIFDFLLSLQRWATKSNRVADVYFHFYFGMTKFRFQTHFVMSRFKCEAHQIRGLKNSLKQKMNGRRRSFASLGC